MEQQEIKNEEREENLVKKQAIIGELQQLLERQDDFNKVFNDFKDLQARWRAIGAVPAAKQRELWDTYNYNVEKFYDVVKINRELRELDFKKNFELKQLLCEKAEELLLEADVAGAFRKLQKYHEQWRDIGPVATELRESLWERFKNTTAQINKKHQDYFDELKVEQQNNLNLKQVLCEKAEEMAAAAAAHNTVKEWNEKTDELLELQKMWKTIGAVARKDSQRVFDEFRKSCNAFFDARRNFFQEQKTEYTHNLQQKLELCAQAEQLSESEEWKKATDELVALQARWKEIGAVPHKQSEVVWGRFRTACNKFFDRKKEHFSTLNATPKPRVESVSAKGGNSSGGGGGRGSDSGGRGFLGEREKLTQQVKRLEADIQLWENNIGFFAKSKNAEKMIQDVNKNIEKARREIAAAREKIKALENSNNDTQNSNNNTQNG